jgi:glutathione peroxidase
MACYLKEIDVLTRVAVCLTGFAVLLVSYSPTWAGEKGGKKVAPVLKFKMTSLDGKEVDLSRYQGKVVLIVNVASECGYTKYYKGLQALHARFGKEGLAVLGFPCNEFGGQEPGTEAEIATFCKKNYGVEFDMFSKISVQGKDACPLYKFLTSKETNPKHSGPVSWNFEKFLIGRDGTIVARFEPAVNPESEEVVSAITKELAKK